MFVHRLPALIARITLLAVVLGAVTAPAQQQQQPPQSQQPATPAEPQKLPEPNSPPGAQVPGVGSTLGNAPQNAPGISEQPAPETHITKQQARELFRSVDEILRIVSQDTGMPIEHKVKRELITREQVEHYVGKRMQDDKDAKRLEQARLVLEKFGLLPQGYDLHAEFLKLMGEQVAAYYDPKSKSVNLLDWLPIDAQKAVLAHELTHALQDQQVDLAKWELAGAKDESALPDPQEYVAEEAQSARQAVTEGQAQVVWFDYSLAPLGKNIITAPEFVDAVRATMGDSKDSPIFSAAPMFLKESMLMPYTFGLDFVRTVLTSRGKEAAFAGLLQDPPHDTRQIMQPETYLLHQLVAPPAIPDFDKIVAPNYERFDFGSMGEFDIYLLAKQYGANDAPNYYRHWRGGYYFAARPKNGPKDQIAMLYYSKWDSPEAARDFAKLYADYLPKRYKQATRQATNESSLVEFQTEQGPAVIEAVDNELLIMEGYDSDVMEKARGVFFYHMTPAVDPAKKKK